MSSDRGTRGPRLGRDDGEVRAASRFVLLISVAAVGVLLVTGLWARGCGTAAAAVETVACGTPVRLLLVLGSPVVFGAGGLIAFLRTLRIWRVGGTWWAWQGAGWFLLAMMLIVLTLSAGPIAGPPHAD